MKHLEGRVAVVTGAGSGIGRSLALALGQAGCRVVAGDVEREALERTRAELDGVGCECEAVVVDVADAQSVDDLASRTTERFGEVHILCNSAGVSARRAITDMALEDWRWVIGVDLWGVIHGIHSFLPLLVRQPEAHVVNVSSMAGLLPFVLGGPYNAAKAGVIAISETLEQEMNMLGTSVGVSVVCPGGVRTRFLDSERNRPRALLPELRRQSSSATTFADIDARARRLIETEGMDPAEVADTVLAAVRSRTFYVLTHRDEYRGAIEQRTRDILAGDAPSAVVVEKSRSGP